MKFKPYLIKCVGDGSVLKIAISDFFHRSYVYEFTFPKKALTEKLAGLLFDNSQLKGEHAEIKITSKTFKGLMNTYRDYITDVFKKADLVAIKNQYNLANIGIAYEYYYKNKGYIKTDYITDKINKIDVIKGRSKVQLKACLILDDSKGAYSTCHTATI